MAGASLPLTLRAGAGVGRARNADAGQVPKDPPRVVPFNRRLSDYGVQQPGSPSAFTAVFGALPGAM